MNIITKLKKDETPSQKLSKHFERIFNTKETFIFDLENQNSTVHLYGWITFMDHLNEKSLNANKGNNNGEENC
jgi:superoxide dismutase